MENEFKLNLSVHDDPKEVLLLDLFVVAIMVGPILLASMMSHRRMRRQREASAANTQTTNRGFTRNPNYRAPFSDARTYQAQLARENNRRLAAQQRYNANKRRRRRRKSPKSRNQETKHSTWRGNLLSLFWRNASSTVYPAATNIVSEVPTIAVATPYVAETVATPVVTDDIDAPHFHSADAMATPVVMASTNTGQRPLNIRTFFGRMYYIMEHHGEQNQNRRDEFDADAH